MLPPARRARSEKKTRRLLEPFVAGASKTRRKNLRIKKVTKNPVENPILWLRKS